MRSSSEIQFLHRLAHLYGVQTAYYDVSRRRIQASPEALLAAVKALGAPVQGLPDVHSAWRERRQESLQSPLPPVIVAWDGQPPSVAVTLPCDDANSFLDCHLKLENGEERLWRSSGEEQLETDEVEGTKYRVRKLELPHGMPLGYHRLTIEAGGKKGQSLIISAPVRAYRPQSEQENRTWGVFIPLYSLHTQRSWGGGSFSDLAGLLQWTGELGGKVVATLPLLPAFLDHVFEPSPYLPVSHLLWNEFFLDVSEVPELADCPAARELLASTPFQDEISALRRSVLVDYRRQMALKRKALELLSRCFFQGESTRREYLNQFSTANPIVDDYARFRAVCEKRASLWRTWPQPLSAGVLSEGDYKEEDRLYHLYVQWLAHQQMTDVSKKARDNGLQLYLDLPTGVHPDGYDVWRERDTYLLGAIAGAPPDTVFTGGQTWDFPPMHPHRIREQGYRYMIATLRHHLKHAGILRIDHVMGLHRIFCIPAGMEARQGVYLRYHAEETYAVLALESQRHKALIVGEDLGTVPSYVRPAMKRHGLHSTYVVQYELADDTRKGIPQPPARSVASANTHDMPPFAAFWHGLDIEQRLGLGLLDKAGARREEDNLLRMKTALLGLLQDSGWLSLPVCHSITVLNACLSFLAASPAQVLLVNIEDLWGETKPQNIPSTRGEYPNWQRKTQYELEDFDRVPHVVETLKNIDRLRRRGIDGP